MNDNIPDDFGTQDEQSVVKAPQKSKIPLLNIKAFQALKNPVFRLYYGASIGQQSAINMQMVARSLLIYRLTGSAALLGTMALAHSLPAILTSLFGGALADRMPKKYLMLTGRVVATLLFTGIGISFTTGYLNSDTWWILMVSSVISGVFQGISIPSRQSIIPEIVGEQSIMNAIALNNLATSLIRFVGPALAGFLIDVFDFEVVYYIMAAISMISVILVALMPLTNRVVKSSTNMFTSIIEGIQYVWRNKTVLFVLLFMLVAIFLARPIQQLMPIFTEDIFKVSATSLGLLAGIGGAGSTIGSIILASLPNKKRGLMLLAAYLLSGLALVIFSFNTSYYLAIAMMILLGVALAFRRTLTNTLAMHYTEDKYRGRVMSIHEMDLAIASLGTFGAGILAELVGVQWAIGSFASGLIIISISVIAFVPRLRRLD